MKKILFASTALIATASVAAADVKLGGYGRFGIIYVEDAARETSIESRFRLNIDGTTTADNGVTFGARVRMQADDITATGDAGAAGLNGARFYATSGGLTVAAGNIYGAIDSMPNLYHGSVGLSGLGYADVITNFGADDYQSTGNGVNGVEVIYEADMFTIHASYSDPSARAERLAVAGSASFMGYTIALGYQDSDTDNDVEFIGIVGGEVGPVSLSAGYAQDQGGEASYVVSAAAEVAMGIEVKAYYTRDENQADEDAYGIGASYGLGGGASIRGGVADRHGNMAADLGVFFSF